MSHLGELPGAALRRPHVREIILLEFNFDMTSEEAIAEVVEAGLERSIVFLHDPIPGSATSADARNLPLELHWSP